LAHQSWFFNLTQVSHDFPMNILTSHLQKLVLTTHQIHTEKNTRPVKIDFPENHIATYIRKFSLCSKLVKVKLTNHFQRTAPKNVGDLILLVNLSKLKLKISIFCSNSNKGMILVHFDWSKRNVKKYKKC
jgi:hypothetical protein